ncbi:MAG: TRL domain-containing protein [Planctomycetota bacterium]|jgi:hypothetical protein
MKNLTLLLVAVLSLSLFTGCVLPMASPVYAPIIADAQGPLMLNGAGGDCSKMGTSEAMGIIIFSSGNASIKKAMENGGITKVHHVDFKVLSVLGLYTKWETIVYGE